MKKLLLVICFVLCGIFVSGQNHALIDSLQKQLNYEKTDTIKADILNALSMEYNESADYLKAQLFANQALSISQKSKYYKGTLTAYVYLIYANHLDWVKGKVYCDKALELAKKMNNKSVLAKIYLEIASYLSSLNQFHPEIYAIKALEIYTELKDSDRIAETCNKLSDIYASWDKRISKGEPQIALKYLDESFKISKKKGDVDGIMQCYMAYGNIYKLYYGNKSKTREYLILAEKEIGYYLKKDPVNKRYITREHMAYFQWAMYYMEMEKDFKQAELYLKKAISIAVNNIGNNKTHDLNLSMLGTYYKDLGQLYLDYNQANKAEQFFNKYIDNESVGDTVNLCFTLLNIEWIYRNKGMLAIAYNYLDRVLELNEKAKNMWINWQSKYYLADLYQLMDDNETGKDFYFNCYQIAKKGNHFAGQIVSLTDISKMYAKMDNLDSALFYNKEAEKLNASSIKDTLLYVWIYNDLGGIYEKKKDFKKALQLYLKVDEIRENNNWNQTIETPYSYFATNSSLAKVNLELKQYDKAYEFVNKSLNSFQFIKYPEVLRDDYLTLSKIYEYRNQHIKALEYYKKYLLEKEKILADQNQRKIQLIEIEKIKTQKKLEIESLNVRNQLKETKLKQQRYFIYSIIAVLVLVLILVIVVYKSFRQKSTANKLLRKNELELIDKNKRLQQLNEEVHVQNEQITVQRDLLTRQNEKITDSIVYASLIQCALLPSDHLIKNMFPNHFILFKPRDLVSGDFYWFKQIRNFVYIAIADCTGHGVPGALMGTLGISMLNEFMNTNEIKLPENILEELRTKIKSSLHQSCTEDGMDMAMCMINMETNRLYFSGANLPFYLIRDNKLIEFKGNRMPIGRYPKDDQKFSSHEIELKPSDKIYIFSDGFVSQFGGERALKYSVRRFREKLLSIQDLDMETQKQELTKSLSSWQDKNDQVDDILVMGIQI